MDSRRDTESRAIEDLRDYGRSLVEGVPVVQAEMAVGRVLASRHQSQRPRRLVLMLASAGLLAVSNVALAAVSDAAAPGDFLYPLDRGYERVSDLFGDTDRTIERLAESETLVQRGDIDHAIAFLRELATESSNEALLAAIQKLEARGEQGQGNQNDQGPATPATTAPGQLKDGGSSDPPASPSETAPGRIQGDDADDSPSDTAPGRNKDAPTKSNGALNGNDSRGNDRA
ncbi:MAG TPA: hypothetical protein VM848_15235 [Acidimicrobiia bacterium]|nr:hypothetical protein [Acidimicrobiia bacterium]